MEKKRAKRSRSNKAYREVIDDRYDYVPTGEDDHVWARRANGECSIRKRKDGRCTAGHDPLTEKNVLGKPLKEKLAQALVEAGQIPSADADCR